MSTQKSSGTLDVGFRAKQLSQNEKFSQCPFDDRAILVTILLVMTASCLYVPDGFDFPVADCDELIPPVRQDILLATM